MEHIPFLKPTLLSLDSYKEHIEKIEENGIYTNNGPFNRLFEQNALESYFNNIGAVTTVNNATMGLITSISSMKRKAGKYALMPSFTFSATPLAAMWCGLEPYFIDVDEETWLMDEEKLGEALNLLGDKVAVVVPYATFGTYLDLSYYNHLQENGIPVVVDAAPCFGTTYQNRHIGQGFKGAFVFSFHATKPFGIGEGGLVYSRDEDLIRQIRVTANFGYNGSRESVSQGINAKLSEFYAAIGLATLDVYSEKIKKRIDLYKIYIEEFQKLRLLEKGWQVQKTKGEIPFQFFSILVPENEKNIDYINKLASKNIQAVSYFAPACHQQKQFENYKFGDLSVTNDITKRVISLPFWEEMDRETVKYVVSSLVEFRERH